MADTVRVTYLDHSGFILETANHILIFDYYRDPARALKIAPDKALYIFSSHAHGDHFNLSIANWQQQAAAYILSSDIADAGGLPNAPKDKVHYLAPYEHLDIGQLRINAYGSTDQGASFAVTADGWRIFHAGDLNWWHWKEDTPENIAQAKQDFFRELSHLDGQQFDLAFFPVDSRLEEFRDIGVREFVKSVRVSHLAAMHACGQAWNPPADFTGYAQSLWCPGKPGESRELAKQA